MVKLLKYFGILPRTQWPQLEPVQRMICLNVLETTRNHRREWQGRNHENLAVDFNQGVKRLKTND